MKEKAERGLKGFAMTERRLQASYIRQAVEGFWMSERGLVLSVSFWYSHVANGYTINITLVFILVDGGRCCAQRGERAIITTYRNIVLVVGPPRASLSFFFFWPSSKSTHS